MWCDAPASNRGACVASRMRAWMRTWLRALRLSCPSLVEHTGDTTHDSGGAASPEVFEAKGQPEMLRPDSFFVYDLARQHQHDLMAEAERDRLVRMVRLAHPTPSRPARRYRLRIVTSWHQLGQALGRVSESWRLASNGQW
jgi:hypothetical protein